MDPSPPPRAAAPGNRRGRHRGRSNGRRALRDATRALIGVVSVAIVMATGLAYSQAHGLLSGITVSQALGSDEPRSSGGAMNILLIGLDSRKDQDGNELPDGLLDKLHAGDSDSGGYNTNTLILVHISADDRVVAFSIPRDDYVAVTGIKGYSHIKIKEAYGLTKAQTEQKLADEGVSDRKELERDGREAGRKATIRAVRNLTGQPIDYFAEVNLASFYHLADSLGGVEVCLNHAVHDDYSGADFPAGRQILNAEQALAFVRQRHGLENGDLDRTHRQQAFLLSVTHQLQQSGSFTDLDKFKRLMEVARQDIVLSEGWGEDQFRRMAALAGGDVEFRTLPVVRYENINGQDVNIVDPKKIRAEIARAIGGDSTAVTTAAVQQPLPPPNPNTKISIVNASDISGLAAQAATLLGKHDFTVSEVRDRESGEPIDTVITYGAGAQADAQSVASLLGVENAPQSTSSVAADHVRVVLGDGYDLPLEQLQTPDSTETSTSRGWSDMSVTPTPDQGAPIDGGSVPCVN